MHMGQRESFSQSLSPGAVEEYLSMKRRLDPEGVLQSDLYRRVFA
jgi:hypothetical protein